jgi:hypothetical protein
MAGRAGSPLHAGSGFWACGVQRTARPTSSHHHWGVTLGPGEYVDKYGVPPVGKRVFIPTRQQVNGWQDSPKQTTAVVPRG